MGLSYEEFDSVFQRFADSPTARSVFRLEALQNYQVPTDDPFLTAFRSGSPRPERSVRTSPWLARLATSTANGKTWQRVHLIREPLSEYVRFEMVAYVESQAAGEVIHVADVNASGLDDTGPDFWLFDDSEGAYAVLMHYDTKGAPLSFDYETDPQVLNDLNRQRTTALSHAQPLNQYLAQTALTGKAAS